MRSAATRAAVNAAFSLQRFFNSLTTDAAAGMGPGWSAGPVPTERLEFPSTSQVTFIGPSGYRARFDKDASGGYVRSAPGIDARLTFDTGSNSYRLLWNSKDLDVFDTTGRLVRQEDKQGNQITYTYDSAGLLDELSDTQGRVVDFHWSGGLLSYVTDVAGQRVIDYTYASFAGDPTLRLASSEVDSYGLRSDPVNVGVKTRYGYDAEGRLTTVTDPEGNLTQFGYETGGRRVTTLTRVTGSTSVPDPTTTFSYFADTTGCGTSGSPVRRTRVDGPRTDLSDVTTYCVDAHDRVVTTIDAKGHKQSSGYTSNSNVASFNESDGTAAYGYSWSGEDNLVQITLPTGGSARASYTDPGNRNFPTSVFDYANASTSDAAGTWVYDYDTRGNLIEAKNTAAAVTYRYCYDAKGMLQRIDAPPVTVALDESTTAGCGTANQGNDTLFSYDTSGNLTSIDRPGPHGTQSFTYDPLSRVETKTDGRGVVTEYDYDALDHVVEIEYSNPGSLPGTPAILYSYDANGNLLETDPTNAGDTLNSYDELNRLTHTSTDDPAWTVDYGYDTAGNLTSLDASDAPAVTYGYDNLNRLTSLVDQKSRTTTFGYNNRDQRTSTSYPNGVTQKQVFDNARRTTCLYAYTGTAPGVGANGCPTPATSLLTYYGYTYTSPGGRDTPTRYTETTRTGETTTYSYDPILRLTRARTLSGGTEVRDFEYNLDGRGNITRETVTGAGVPNATTTMAYTDASELCWTAPGTPAPDCATTPTGATSYSYDNAGNLTGASTGLALTYSRQGQTVSVTPPGGSAFTMAYQGATSDDRSQAGNLDMSSTVLGLTAQGASASSYTDWFTRDPHGRLIGMLHRTDSAKDVYYLTDDLGSIAATTNTAGTVVNRYTYTPYGKQLSPNPAALDTNGDPADRNPYRYAAGYYDTTTGMLKFGTRYYRPDLMRWTQTDPIAGNPANPMSLNPYTYVGCNPTNLKRPRFSAALIRVAALG